MKITEELLWKYIEGNCTDAEQMAVKQALEDDVDLKKEWLERKILHQMMEKQELESPSMRFTKNVMESLPKLSNYAITSKQLRPFFLVIFGSLLAIVLLSVSTEAPPPIEDSPIKQLVPNGEAISSFFLQDQLLFVGLALGAVAILLLIDQVMQRRMEIN
ncbi:MAG: hypothetical protein AAFP82_15150 [Bacteroidota bacterium]